MVSDLHIYGLDVIPNKFKKSEILTYLFVVIVVVVVEVFSRSFKCIVVFFGSYDDDDIKSGKT